MAAVIGTLVAVLISLLSVPGMASWAKLGITNVQKSVMATQLMAFDKAAQQYVQDNAAAIAAVATATTPVTVTAANLQAANYLPAGFSAKNPFQQTLQLQVLQPSAGQLQALVTSQGGTPISDTKELVQIAAQAGAQGGFIPYANQAGDATMTPTNAYGAYGAWKLPMTGYTNPGSGHLASLLIFSGSQANNGFLYRVAVPGQPQLNDMQTDLGMTDVGGTAHNITGANQISTQSLKALANGTKAVPSVQLANGTVVAYNQVGEGGVLGLTGANGQSIYLESLNGTFRLVNNPWNLALFTVDQNGNVSATGTVTAPTRFLTGGRRKPPWSRTKLGEWSPRDEKGLYNRSGREDMQGRAPDRQQVVRLGPLARLSNPRLSGSPDSAGASPAVPQGAWNALGRSRGRGLQ